MPTLSRRPDGSHDGWHVYFGDVRIGQIGRRSGVPNHTDQWGWIIGFHPGTSTRLAGSAPSFEAAREQFETAWSRPAPTLTADNSEAWRRNRDFRAWKHRMWGTGCQLPTQNTDGPRGASAARP
ncbi:hypothetical protein [Bradyrhizobium tunisiense]|uniref:hypothetical protein n=1 Tax=Bradyrhizobium tunisiense TaxID=3278709 RepID=UPI0035D97C32